MLPPEAETTATRVPEDLDLVAWATTGRFEVQIEPAPRFRAWSDEMADRWANRCLPLLVANQAGWVLRNPIAFTACWSGGDSPSDTTIELAVDLPHPWPVESHFGYGILTWAVPWLFRTPEGYNLLARGPANWPKDGATALEGLVETDWAVTTFTMNWKLTRPGHSVRFEEGEPFCMVLPQRRGELEAFRPRIRDLADDPSTRAEAEQWAKERDRMQVRKFLADYAGEFGDYRRAWEAHYFKGLTPRGDEAPAHQTQLKLRAFTGPEHEAVPPVEARETGPAWEGSG